MTPRYSIFLSVGCCPKEHCVVILLEVLSFACEGFSSILSGPMKITWIKSKHMVSYRNASIILPFWM